MAVRKLDGAAAVGVEDAEHALAELVGVALGEKPPVHGDELGPGDVAGGVLLLRRQDGVTNQPDYRQQI